MNAPAVRLGLSANIAQFSLLVVVNAFVGAMVGMERSILPAIAERDFHLLARSAVLSFIVVFGVTKALSNYVAGRLSDRFGRKHILVAGWLTAAPVSTRHGHECEIARHRFDPLMKSPRCGWRKG